MSREIHPSKQGSSVLPRFLRNLSNVYRGKIEFRNEFIVKNRYPRIFERILKVLSRYQDSRPRIGDWITNGVQFVTQRCVQLDQRTHISSNKQYRGTKSGSLFPSINRPHSRRRTMTVTRRSAINRGDRSRYSRGAGIQFICERDKIGFKAGAQVELSSAAPPPI